MTGYIQPDELSQRLDVFCIAMKTLRIRALSRPAVSCGNRVDHDQIRHIQDGVLVVHETVRPGKRKSFIVHQSLSWAESSKMKPDRRGARPSIESKRDGAPTFVFCTVLGVSRKENICLGLLSVFVDEQVACCRRIFQRFSV